MKKNLKSIFYILASIIFILDLIYTISFILFYKDWWLCSEGIDPICWKYSDLFLPLLFFIIALLFFILGKSYKKQS